MTSHALRTGLLLLGAAGSGLLLFWSLTLSLGFVRGAPFVPTRRARAAKMLEFARPRPGESWIDLGSGDGRLLIAAARAGATAVGYEFHPLLIFWSRLAIRFHGLQGLAEVRRGDLWAADVSKADVVSIYMMPWWMLRMQKKLRAELKPGCRVVSNAFLFPDWAPAAYEDRVALYLQP
jgi:hypothetical protein